MNAVAGACWHCSEPLPADAPSATVSGIAHPVCCHGCRAAAEWIDQLGLGDYYRLRSAPAQRAPERTESERSSAAWARPELARHVVRDVGAGQHEAIILIEGVRCAACVWLIERSLDAVPGVAGVQVNAAARSRRSSMPSPALAIARCHSMPPHSTIRANANRAQR